MSILHMPNKDRIALSQAFNAAILAHIEANGPQTSGQLCQLTGNEARALRAKLCRMMHAGIIHSLAVEGQQGHHVLYHAGPKKVDAFESGNKATVRNWTAGMARRDPYALPPAFFGASPA